MKKVSLLLLAALFMLLPFAAMAQTDLAALENANSTIAIMGVPDIKSKLERLSTMATVPIPLRESSWPPAFPLH